LSRDGDAVGEAPQHEAQRDTVAGERRHHGTNPGRVTAQAEAITPGGDVQAEVSVPLVHPRPARSARHPELDDLGKCAVGPRRVNLDRQLGAASWLNVTPCIRGDGRPVDADQPQRAREAHIAGTPRVARGPAHRSGQRDGLQQRARGEPRPEQQSVQRRRAQRLLTGFGDPADQAGQREADDAATRVGEHVPNARHPPRYDAVLQQLHADRGCQRDDDRV